jgi:hypothetical protein
MKHAFSLALNGVVALALSAMAAWLALREPRSVGAVVLWLAALLVVLWAAWRDERHAGMDTWLVPFSQQHMWEWALVGGFTVLGFALRAYDLRHYPLPVHGDEGEMGVLALQILNGDGPPPFATGWLDHPTLFHYLQAGSLAMWGRNEVGLRMLGAWWGAACVPLVYAVGRIGWGRAAAMVAAWLLAVSHLHNHFSRIGLNNIQTVTALLVLFLLLMAAYQRAAPRMMLFVGAGLVIGLSQYLYYGSRLLPIIAVPLMWLLWRAQRAGLRNIAAMMTAFAVAYAPLGVFYLTHRAQFTSRTAGVLVFSAPNVQRVLGPSAVLPRDIGPLLWEQLVRNLQFFWRTGDRSTFYSGDIIPFDAITRTLFWIGLVVAVVGIRRWSNRMLLAWWGLGLLIGGVLTRDAPNAPRLLVIVPAVCLLGGVAAQYAWAWLHRARLWQAWHIAPFAVVVAALTLAINIDTYFITYARSAGGLVPITAAREMIAAPRADAVLFLGPPYVYAAHGTIQFVAGAVEPQDFEGAEQVVALRENGQRVLLVAVPERAAELDALAQQFPGGSRTTRVDSLGRLIGAAYRFPPVR